MATADGSSPFFRIRGKFFFVILPNMRTEISSPWKGFAFSLFLINEYEAVVESALFSVPPFP